MLYALADLNDPERGWGLAGETWNFMAAMERLGGETWFRLGDRDLATHVLRTHELNAGKSLSDVCAIMARRLGIAHRVVPMSDDPVRSIVETDEGPLDFQDYFVRRQCKPAFRGVTFQGAADARPSATFREALDQADAVVITPSNPFVSIDPILALPGVREALRRPGRPVVAVSPIVGGHAVKGPLAKMLRELGMNRPPRAWRNTTVRWSMDGSWTTWISASPGDRKAWPSGARLQYHDAHPRRQARLGAGYAGTRSGIVCRTGRVA